MSMSTTTCQNCGGTGYIPLMPGDGVSASPPTIPCYQCNSAENRAEVTDLMSLSIRSILPPENAERVIQIMIRHQQKKDKETNL